VLHRLFRIQQNKFLTKYGLEKILEDQGYTSPGKEFQKMSLQIFLLKLKNRPT